MQRESKKPNLYTELFHRHPSNPILTAQDWPYPANSVFNAGACQVGDETILLVRVEDRRGHSHLTVARSNDGVSNWHVDSNPSFPADVKSHTEEAWGVEDPRLTWVEDRNEWIIACTAWAWRYSTWKTRARCFDAATNGSLRPKRSTSAREMSMAWCFRAAGS